MSDVRRCLLLILAFYFLSLLRQQTKGIMGNITTETNVCTNVTTLRRDFSFIWQPIIPGHSYIYSAHIDNRDDRKMIKVVTIIEVNMTENFNLYCHVWYSYASYVTVVKAEAEPKVGTGNFK